MLQLMLVSGKVLGLEQAAQAAHFWVRKPATQLGRAFALESWGMACQVVNSPNTPLAELFPAHTNNSLKKRFFKMRRALLKAAKNNLKPFEIEQVRAFCAQITWSKEARVRMMHSKI